MVEGWAMVEWWVAYWWWGGQGGGGVVGLTVVEWLAGVRVMVE